MTLTKKFVAELVGTAMLLAAIVGSGIMAERLSGGNTAVALLANSIATGAALVAIIVSLGATPGAHINPVVTLSLATRGDMGRGQVACRIAGQFMGAILGVAVAHAMFGLPLFFASHHARAGFRQMFSEAVATFGLLTVVWGCAAQHVATIAWTVAAYVTAAYWFTSSTSFANPAVTLARAATDTFTGIRPVDVPGFILAQGIGAATATALFRWLSSASSTEKK
jgi:glycerol uptake facilitator-like aquaporin